MGKVLAEERARFCVPAVEGPEPPAKLPLNMTTNHVLPQGGDHVPDFSVSQTPSAWESVGGQAMKDRGQSNNSTTGRVFALHMADWHPIWTPKAIKKKKKSGLLARHLCGRDRKETLCSSSRHRSPLVEIIQCWWGSCPPF